MVFFLHIISMPCNIFPLYAIPFMTMVGAMVEKIEYSESDLNELVVRARTQGQALAALYECMVDSVFRFCVHRVAEKAAAEDICSEVFLQVARGIRVFHGSTYMDFRNWVFAIAANQANGYLRKHLRRVRLLQAREYDLAPPVIDGLRDIEALDWPVLHAAILCLKPQYQTILTLRFFENMDYASIGAIVNSRPGTVRVTLHRILKKLRQHLLAPEEEGHDDV
jgi:RNA polymerase sigma-70 factor (ECF subfamily)